jgi:hypothetical protein
MLLLHEARLGEPDQQGLQHGVGQLVLVLLAQVEGQVQRCAHLLHVGHQLAPAGSSVQSSDQLSSVADPGCVYTGS